MANEGLTITEKEFLSLPPKHQMLLIFKNQEGIRCLVEGYKFWYKINAVVTGGLTIGLAYLFKMHFIQNFLPLLALFLIFYVG